MFGSTSLFSADSTKMAQHPIAYPCDATLTYDLGVLSGRIFISLKPARV
jgi:hypothetical protein